MNTAQNWVTILRQEGLPSTVKRIGRKIFGVLIELLLEARFWLTLPRGAKVVKISEIAENFVSNEPAPEYPSIGTTYTQQDRVQDGTYWHNFYLAKRTNVSNQGYQLFNGRRVLFVLPVKAAGGGSNLVFLAAQAMRSMGVDAQILNLNIYRSSFEKSYPNTSVPLIYSDTEDVPEIAAAFDAVVATSNTSVSWIAPVQIKNTKPVIGYFIQDYEPYFYPPDTTEFHLAASSYTMIPNMVRCVTTQWIDDQIKDHHSVSCHVIGGYLDVDLFRPRPHPGSSWPDRPVHIAAMIRPVSERRGPRMTMEVLQLASKMYGSRLQFTLFGFEPGDPGFARLPKDFPWQLAGELRPAQVANLLNQCDIFVDYSVYQAFGLTALESMSCGLATIVPMQGGADTFAKHEENCLVVDTQNQTACFNALQQLVEDDFLRQKLQRNAIPAAVQFYPELPAYNLLDALFRND